LLNSLSVTLVASISLH